MIRPLRESDLAAVIAMEVGAATAAHWNVAEYERLLDPGKGPGRLSLVAEEGGQMTGFIVASTVGREWEIENVVVSHDHRRRGIGALLIQSLVDQARHSDACEITLEVRSLNHPAKMLYLKCGFLEVGRRKSYYSVPEDDAILYKLLLSAPQNK